MTTPDAEQEQQGTQFKAESSETPAEEVLATPVVEAQESEAASGEPDYKVLYEKARDEADKERQRASSIEGNVRSQKERDARTEEALTESRKARQYAELLLERDSNPELSADDVRQRMSTITAEEERASFVTFVKDTAVEMDTMIDESGIDRNHPVISEAFNTWAQLKDAPNQLNRLIDIRARVNKTVLDHTKASQAVALEQAKEAGRVEAAQSATRSASTNLGGLEPSGGQGLTNQERWSAYGRGEVPWSPDVMASGKAIGAL